MSLDAGEDASLRIGLLWHASGHEVDCGIEREAGFLKVLLRLVKESGFLHGNVDQSRLRTVRDGVPTVAAQRSGSEWGSFTAVFVPRVGIFKRATCLRIDSGRPGDRGVGFCGNDITGGAIEYVEESVLRSLKKNLSPDPVDCDVGKDDWRGGIVVPCIAGNFLVVPNVFAGVGFERDDRAGEQIVFSFWAPGAAVPRSPVAGPDVEQVELGVVDDGVPDGAACAELPPFAAPAFCSLFECRAFERFCGIARNGVEAPRELARFGVVSGDVTAHAHLCAAVADENFAFDDPWSSCDRVAIFVIDGKSFPDGFSRGGVESDEAAIERADVKFSAPGGYAAVDYVAAGVECPFGRDFWIVGPEFFACRGVCGEDLAPRC